MRSIWNGTISFGLVSIPVKLMNATESRSISFRQVHLEDGGRIRYRKFCELEDREVTQAEIGKGYEDADGEVVPVTDEDLAQLPLPTTRTIEIVAFVPADRIDPLQMDTAYYLSANGAPAAKPYTLLREALRRSGKVAVAKYALRGRERLGMLRAFGDVIAMHGLLWPDEIRAPEGVVPDTGVTVRDRELDLADTLMDTLGEVDLEELHDEYREAVEELIAAKAEGRELPAAPEPEGGKVLDLTAALERSVRAAKESRGAAGTTAAVRRLPARAPGRAVPKETGGKKSAAAGKTTAAKSTAGKTTAAKSTAKKSTTKTATKTAAKTTAEKTTAEKGTAKRPAKKGTAKKTAAKKATAGKAAAGKGTAKKATAGKGTAGKGTAKKTAAKKATAEKATAEKTAARKHTA